MFNDGGASWCGFGTLLLHRFTHLTGRTRCQISCGKESRTSGQVFMMRSMLVWPRHWWIRRLQTRTDTVMKTAVTKQRRGGGMSIHWNNSSVQSIEDFQQYKWYTCTAGEGPDSSSCPCRWRWWTRLTYSERIPRNEHLLEPSANVGHHHSYRQCRCVTRRHAIPWTLWDVERDTVKTCGSHVYVDVNVCRLHCQGRCDQLCFDRQAKSGCSGQLVQALGYFAGLSLRQVDAWSAE